MHCTAPIDKKLVPPASRDPIRIFEGARLEALLRESLGRCAHPFCDSPYLSLEAHHILYHSCGGPTEPINGLMLCVNCHRLLHAGFMPSRYILALKQNLRDTNPRWTVETPDSEELLACISSIR